MCFFIGTQADANTALVTPQIAFTTNDFNSTYDVAAAFTLNSETDDIYCSGGGGRNQWYPCSALGHNALTLGDPKSIEVASDGRDLRVLTAINLAEGYVSVVP